MHVWHGGEVEVGGTHCDIAGNVTLDGLEGCAAQDIEQAGQGLGGLEEFGGGDGVVFASIDGHVDEGAFAIVKVRSTRGICHWEWCRRG